MNRCLLVATVGSPAAQSALRYALDFATAIHAGEIACVSVREHDRGADVVFAPAIAAAEISLATGCSGPVMLVNDRPRMTATVDPDAVFDACLEQVTAGGFRFTPFTSAGSASTVLLQLKDFCETVFLGRFGWRSDGDSKALGSTVLRLLKRSRQTLFVCPPMHQAVRRVVIAHAGREAAEGLLGRGTQWAKAFRVPLLVAVAERRSSHAARRQEIVRRALERLAVEAVCETYGCKPAELPSRLLASDLLIIGHYGRWWPVRFWCGSNTEAILRRATGPVAVLPSDVS